MLVTLQERGKAEFGLTEKSEKGYRTGDIYQSHTGSCLLLIINLTQPFNTSSQGRNIIISTSLNRKQNGELYQVVRHHHINTKITAETNRDAQGVETIQPGEQEKIQEVSDQFNRFQMMNFNEHHHCLRGTHLKTQGVCSTICLEKPIGY